MRPSLLLFLAMPVLAAAHPAAAQAPAPAPASSKAVPTPPLILDNETEDRCERALRAKPDKSSGAWDYAAAVRRTSCRHRPRPRGERGRVELVIIHTCESGYAGCWGYLTTDPKNLKRTSAHYVVSADGSEVSQLVPEVRRARHIGATYQPGLNQGVLRHRAGHGTNDFSIGIEHAGKAHVTRFTPGLLDASARLGCDIARRYRIPIDANHFVAHGQLQPTGPNKRTDPGKTWPWAEYLRRVRGHCGDVSTKPVEVPRPAQPVAPVAPVVPAKPAPQPAVPGPANAVQLEIDSDNANNDVSRGYVRVPAGWTAAAAAADRYRGGYYFAATQPVSDPATFWFYLPAPARRTVDARWPAGTNRSAMAPFVVFDANGTRLGAVHANQQVNGGRWNELGTWTFTAGWNRVQLSRWTKPGFVVVADAIRIR